MNLNTLLARIAAQLLGQLRVDDHEMQTFAEHTKSMADTLAERLED